MRTKEVKTRNKGITLIALVVTIVVLLIITGVAISMLTGDDGIITNSTLAKLETEFSAYKEEVELYKNNKLIENNNFEGDSLSAGKTSLEYNTKPEDEEGTIQTVIKDLKENELSKFIIINGKLYIISTDKKEIKAAQNIGISVMPYEITEEGELLSSDLNLALQNEDTIIIPDIVTSIADGAFSGIDGVKTVIIPGSVEKIGANAFSYNSTLETIIIEDGVKEIGESAFRNCENLKKVIIPDTVTSIGKHGFQDCKNLEEVKLSNNIKKLEESLFWGCTNLKTIDIPESVETIDVSVFYECRSLNNIIIPKAVKEINWAAFAFCNNLTNMTIDVKNKYYKIEEGIIYTKNGETLVNVNANGIKGNTLTIKEGVKTILSRSFSLCNNVETINLPSTLTSGISGDTFNGMSSLKNINVAKENSNYFSENNFIYTTNYNDLVFAISSEKVLNINNNVKTIKTMALIGCKNAEIINIPDNVEKIEGWVFSGANKVLKQINIGKGVNNLNVDCIITVDDFIEKVNIDEENPYYSSDENYIYNKDKTKILRFIKDVESYKIPEGVLTIGSNAFYTMSSKLKNIEFPNTLITIEDRAFSSCTSLEKIEIPNNVQNIGNNAFSGCTNLNEIKINKSKDSITGAPWGATKGLRVVTWV